jgi:hypothetical protein
VIEANENGGAAEYSYTYDRASNLKQVTENGQTRSYELNVANQLRCSYAGAQQANCPANDIDYTYDLNGNLTDVENGPALGYDKRNRTATITPFGQTPDPFRSLAYAAVAERSRCCWLI